MAVCHSCGTRYLFKGLNERLAIPEYRSMIGLWPWLSVRVCDACLSDHDRDFMERLRLLAPDVLENNEPIVEPVCLACGTLDPRGAWHQVSKWVNHSNRPVRRATFHLCHPHRNLPYIEGVIVSSNLTDLKQMQSVLNELPAVSGDFLQRVEGWRPDGGTGPAGVKNVALRITRDEAAERAMAFWQGAEEGLEAKAAWLGPVRKDYRMRYRMDLMADYTSHNREVLVIIRIGIDEFVAYSATQHLHKK